MNCEHNLSIKWGTPYQLSIIHHGSYSSEEGERVNLIYQGYRHKKDRPLSGKQLWRCVQTGCSARIHTEPSCEPGSTPQVLHFVDHNHIPDPEAVMAVRVKSKVCELASMNILQPLCSVYKDFITSELARSDNTDGGIIPSFLGCKSQMHRARRAEMPPVPKTFEDINLEGQWSRTCAGERFLLSQADNIIIFATDQNLEVLAQSPIVFMDGTFKSAPRLFRQLFTLHGLYRDHFVALVYCLLPDKASTTYYRTLETLKREMAVRGLVFNPPEVMSDFEHSLLTTVPLLLPTTRLRGCYFHHTQCIWRWVQQNGLVVDYKEDDRIRDFVRKLMALAFLPILLVRSTFLTLASLPVVEENEGCQQLLQYYQETWLSGTFPLRLWNVHAEGTRTNNHIEGWHSKRNKATRKMHPSIHELVDVIEVEQGANEVTLLRARLGAALTTRRPKYRNIDERLSRLRERYLAGETSTEEFLDAVQHLIVHL